SGVLNIHDVINHTSNHKLTTLSLHDALPILEGVVQITIGAAATNAAPVVNDQAFSVDEGSANGTAVGTIAYTDPDAGDSHSVTRSEEHTSELQSREKLVCRLLLEKKKKLHKS